MPIVVGSRYGGASIKPSLGAQPNFGHPLCPDLGLFLFNELGGVPINSANPARLKATPANMLQHPTGAKFDGSTSTIACDSSTIGAMSAMSMVFRFQVLVAPSATYELANNVADNCKMRATNAGIVTEIFSDNFYNATGTTIPVANKTYMAVGTWSAANTAIKTYVNGVLEATTTTSSAAIAAQGGTIQIGRHGNNATLNFLNGVIEYYAFYSRCITADEARWLSEEPYLFMASPRRRVAPVITFSPAWAVASNKVIGFGVY